MKKFTRFIGVLTFAVILSFSLVGCGGNSVSIQYGKKYALGSKYYVFSSNGTGYCEQHSSSTSGRIDFIWKTASDNMVYLFKTDEKYFDDNADGHTVSITEQPLAFGKDFFAYTTVGGYVNNFGGSVVTGCTRYIVEGSDLQNKVKD